MRWSSATSWRYSFTEEMLVVKKTPEKLTHFAHMSPGLKNHRSQHVSRVSGVDDPETVLCTITPETDATPTIELQPDSASAVSGRSVPNPGDALRVQTGAPLASLAEVDRAEVAEPASAPERDARRDTDREVR